MEGEKSEFDVIEDNYFSPIKYIQKKREVAKKEIEELLQKKIFELSKIYKNKLIESQNRKYQDLINSIVNELIEEE